jgi:hypothetical protein
VGIGAFNGAEKMKGLQIGLFNSAIHGKLVQIGFINTIASNPKPFKTLPLINMRFNNDKQE